MTDEFWKKWKNEYYVNITQRQIWKEKFGNVDVGDLVLVEDKDMPRDACKLGIVIAAYPDQDGLVRKTSVRIATAFLDRTGKPLYKPTILDRPVQRLVVIMKAENDK